MKRGFVLSAVLAFVIFLTACGRREGREAQLPTLVATYPASTLRASEASPTAAPTTTPLSTATATTVPTATSEPALPTATMMITPTMTPTITSTITSTAVSTAATTAPMPTATPPASSPLTLTKPLTKSEVRPAGAAIDPAYAGLPSKLLSALASADAVRGQQLTLQTGCSGCHNLDPNLKMTGPTWHNLAARAAARLPGQSAGLYLYTSITEPNAYLVEGYLPNVMVPTYGKTLNDQNLADLIVYLLSLHAEE